MAVSGPLFISSGDLIADRRYDLARDYRGARRSRGRGRPSTRRRSSSRPALPPAWFALGEAREALGDRDGALAASRRARDADREDHHGAALHLARLGAADRRRRRCRAPMCARCSTSTRRASIDALAELSTIAAPELLLRRHGGSRRRGRASVRPMLDLGCGTGLAGAAFRADVDWLVGVDLSPKMIEQARAQGALRPARGRRHRRVISPTQADARVPPGDRGRRVRLRRGSRAESARRSRACSRRAACSASRSRPMTATARRRRQAALRARRRLMSATRSRTAGLTLVRSDARLDAHRERRAGSGLAAWWRDDEHARHRRRRCLPEVFTRWFAARGWAPRAHQLELLAKARAGRSALLIAPTGAGKTLAGFLPSLGGVTQPRSSLPLVGRVGEGVERQRTHP